MSYIGRDISYGNAVSQQITGNNGASYTLDYDTTTSGVVISLDGVVQRNSVDFNIAGTALTFTSTVGTGIIINIIYTGLTLALGIPADGTVTDAKITAMSSSKLVGALPAISGANLTGIVSIPAGSLIDFAGASAPSGWVLCDGSAYNSVSDTSFADLYGVIANVYGGSDGTDFQVPDFRGRVTIGRDNLGGSSANVITHANADTLGGTGGSETHTLTTSELAAHTHNGAAHTHLVGMTNAAGTGTITHRGSGGQQATMTSGNTYPGAGYSTGSGAAHRNDQPWIAVTKIIKK